MSSSLKFAIGIGSSTRAGSEDILQLIEACMIEGCMTQHRGIAASGSGNVLASTVLASIDRRGAIVSTAATTLGLPLLLFPASILAGIPGTSTQSARALKALHTASVAEASALASLGSGARLVVPRRTGRFCTCAIAALPMEDQL
jgi:cobalt-precorrin 5A hydrolase